MIQAQWTALDFSWTLRARFTAYFRGLLQFTSSTGQTWGLMSRLLQLVLHHAYLNQRFPHLAQPIAPLIELAERQARLEQMRKDYYAPFDTVMRSALRESQMVADSLMT
jgi:hypothetical protein